MFRLQSIDDKQGNYEACTAYAREFKFPQKLIWGFPVIPGIEKDIEAVLKYCENFTTQFVDRRKQEYTTGYVEIELDAFIFQGNYASFHEYLIEACFLRVLSNDSTENYPFQRWMRSVMVKGKRNLKDFHHEEHKSQLYGAGHSPFTEIDLLSSPLTVDEYLAPTRIPKLLKIGFGTICKSTYAKALEMKKSQ